MNKFRKLALLGVIFTMFGCSDGGGDSAEEIDLCPNDPGKTAPGVCGCGIADEDSDGDGALDCFDTCESDPEKQYPGICGCGMPDSDENQNGIADCLEDKIDMCPDDDDKDLPGICGCGVADTDSDDDKIVDCLDKCPEDPAKDNPGICGCGKPDDDTDGDGIPDCLDECADFAQKVKAGICGCGMEDSFQNITDSDGDGTPDCIDLCPTNPLKTAPGASGCDVSDTDGDGIEDPLDGCIYNPTQNMEGADCNYVTDGDSQIFEIWTANDFVRLRTEIEAVMPKHPLGMPCAESELVCYEGDSAEATYGVICKADSISGKNVLALDTCPGGCVAGQCYNQGKPMPGTPGDPVPDKCTETETPSKLYDCCTADTFVNICSGSGVLLTCKDGMVREQACAGACSEGACIACLEPKDPAAPAEFECCDAETFHESCDGNAILQCVGGVVKRNTCAYGCAEQDADAKHALCVAGAPVKVEKPLLRIRLMRDIDMSEAADLKVHSSTLGCDGTWMSISLYQMEFDGNKHVIHFTNGKENCDLNDTLFDVLYESTVKDLTLNYNIRGDVSSVFAKYVSRSKISNITVNGKMRLAKAVSGESFATVNGVAGYNATKFGALAAYANYSDFEKIQFSGAIASENSGSVTQLAPLIGDSSAIMVNGASVTLDELSCGAAVCAGGFMLSEKSKAQVSGLTLEAKSINGTNNVIGVSGYLPDIYASRVHIEKLESTGADKRVSALAHTASAIAQNEVYDVTIKLDDVASAGELSSLMHTAQADISSYQLEIGQAKSAKTFYAMNGFGNGTKAVSVKKSQFEVKAYDSETANFVAFLNVAKMANIDDVKVILGNIKANDIYAANNNVSAKSVISNLNVETGTLEAANNIIGMTATLADSTIVDSQLHSENMKAAKTVFFIYKSSGSDVEYTGFAVDEMTAETAHLLNDSTKDTWSNIAVYANPKVKTLANDLIVKHAESTMDNVVSMVHQSTTADGTTYEAVKDHNLGALTADNSSNIWWYQLAGDETAEAHAGETPTASAFDKSKVDDVIATLKNWKKRTFTEDGASVELPWPDKKPEAPAEPVPPEG